MIGRSSLTAVAILLLAVVPACTVDSDVVNEVATVQLVILDEHLQSQSLDNSAPTIQAAEVDVQSATLTAPDWPTLDLTFGAADCAFLDSSLIGPAPVGACASAVVVDGDDQTRPVSLQVTFELTVFRAEPLDLPASSDYDGDGVPNGPDNCPLVDNPSQRDENLDGFGDACSILDLISGVAAADSDLDGVYDTLDNCSFLPNPGQEDSKSEFGTGERELPDGIGDACESRLQTASVVPATIVVTTPAPLDVTLGRLDQTLILVDLNIESSLDCDWTAGTCTIDPSQIAICLGTNTFSGCP